MKRIPVFVGILVVVLATMGAFAFRDDSVYAGIQRSMEMFSSVFRRISMQYVDDVDPEAVVGAGIEHMLQSLDPYSEFIPAGQDNDVEMLSTGKYVGFGITVERLDSVLVVSNVRSGQPAHRAGMRIGDRLLWIDSTRVDTLLPGRLRPYTRGAVGSWASVGIQREGRQDTIILRMLRSEVEVENIAHAERMPDGVAYIKVVRFSRQTGNDVRASINALRRQGSLRGLVLDLRDNPGGLLEAAVDLCGIFLPKGSVVVSTRGRDEEDGRTYRVSSDPLEPLLPMAVLINEGSASASEIVAGALQDHDRGVVLGRRSFGKGLVQTVLDLPFEAKIKLTTARYYTPSGRCIQRVDHSKMLRRVADASEMSRTFVTRSGRIVRELDGIEPDSTIADTVFPAPVQYLLSNSVFFRFGNRLTASWDALPPGFSADVTTVNTFLQFVASQPASRRSAMLASLATTKNVAVNAGASTATIKHLESAEAMASRELDRSLRIHEPLLRELLEQEILSRFSDDRVRIARSLRFDPVFAAAASILGTPRYSTFLAPTSQNEH